MSRVNPIVERIKARRHELDDLITASEAQVAVWKAEAAMLDKLVMPPAAAAPKAPRTPRASRPVKVREHERRIDSPEPGASLPLEQAAD